MTIWSREITAQVADFTGHAVLDGSLLRPQEVAASLEGAVLYSCRALREMLATHALDDEPHSEDMRVYTRPQPHTPLVDVSVVWLPNVQEVELVGGSQDGWIMALERPLDFPDGIRLPTITGAPRKASPDDAVTSVRTGVLVYKMTEWNNTARRWRFTLETSP